MTANDESIGPVQGSAPQESEPEQDYTAVDLWTIVNDFVKSNALNFEQWDVINKELLKLHTAIESPLTKALNKLAAIPIIMDYHTIDKIGKKIEFLDNYAAGIDFFNDSPQMKAMFDMGNDEVSIILKTARHELVRAKEKLLER